MRLKNWFIRNLDDIQREVIIESIDKNIIVQGPAGSGKTNLAIHRALQAKEKGTYAIVIMTPALKRMIAYGMNELGLDNERIAYAWAWYNRGFDLYGDVFYRKDPNGGIDKSVLYLVNGDSVRKFIFVQRGGLPQNSTCQFYGIDFADWVENQYYSTWGRRVSWYKESNADNADFSIVNPSYHLLPSGTLYKPMKIDEKIDYLIIDEAQDFKLEEYKSKIIPKSRISVSLLGDSNQKMNPLGTSIQMLKSSFPEYKTFDLKYNYRLPKTIARVAQRINPQKTDLISNNLKNNGNSDYPSFPKPILKRCATGEDEIKWIANVIQNEALDDVAILVKDKASVQNVIKLLSENGISKVQTFYRTRQTVPYHTINTLDFSNNDLPCILDFFAAKGSEFDKVFIPFSHLITEVDCRDFYVACTRASEMLYISYSGIKPSVLNNIDNNDIIEL